MTVRVIAGDCVREMAALGPVDAIVTDPPYGLEFMGKDWDTFKVGRSAKYAAGGEVNRKAIAGQSGKGGAGPSFVKRPAKRCGKCGKQAWSGSPCRCDMPEWLSDNSPLVAFQSWSEVWARTAYAALKPGGYLLAFGGSRTHHRLWCAIEDAGFVIQDTIMWLYGQGFPKGRTKLKPAHEPICVAYKPGGTRTLQIDECRIEGAWSRDSTTRCDMTGGRFVAGVSGGLECEPQACHPLGRWPANVCHSGDDEVMEAFAAFHTANHGSFPADKTKSFRGGARKQTGVRVDLLDQGSPARFYYAAKAGKADRAGSKHPTVKPIALMRWLVRLVTPPGGMVLDPFAGSGTTGAAAIAEGRSAILIEREPEYIADIRRRIANTRRAIAHAA